MIKINVLINQFIYLKRKYAPKCDRCHTAIAPIGNDRETVRIQAVNKNFHLGMLFFEMIEINLQYILLIKLTQNLFFFRLGCYKCDVSVDSTLLN